LIKIVREAYERFDFHTVYHNIHNFCVVDMSNFYLDVIKDRLYAEKADGYLRRSAQKAMHGILRCMTLLLAPVLSFTAEEIWRELPKHKDDNYESVLFNDMPDYWPHLENAAISEKYDFLLDLRSDVSKALEMKRADKTIGLSLSAGVIIYAKGELYDKLLPLAGELRTVFIVSGLKISNENPPAGAYKGEFGVSVSVLAAEGEKCERCWTVTTDVNEDGICARCASIIGAD
jgi:isoleucyl-tRNA synthetase